MKKDFVIRDRRSKDTKHILDFEAELNEGWDKNQFRQATKPVNRSSLVAVRKGEVVAWCLYELSNDISILRITENPWIIVGYSIFDSFLKRLVRKLYHSRRQRVVLLIEEDRLDFQCHLRDTSYDKWDDEDSGFRAVETIHKNAFERNDFGDIQYLDAYEMEYRKRDEDTGDSDELWD